MKTIAQIAAEIGVSKQAVHKKIKQEPLSTSLRELTSTNGNTILISVDGETLIKQAFCPNIVNQVDEVDDNQPSTFVNQTSTNDNQVDDIRTQFISSLQSQLTAMTEQNKALLQELEKEREHNRAALDREREHGKQQAERIADLADKLAELTRNGQVLLKQEQDRNTPPLLPDEPSQPPEETAEPPPKEGLLKRLFRKK